MKILIVGGTGMIGGHAAGRLTARGHEVVLGARKPPLPSTPMADLPVLIGDYADGDFQTGDLAGFDAIVFAAGSDFRHMPPGTDENAFWRHTQIEGVPRFMETARQAGVPRVVQIGSYYHPLLPELAETHPYVRARRLADEGGRALAAPGFNVCTLNPPSIVGMVPGLPSARFQTLAAYARGEMPDIAAFAPPGGINYMSARSLSEAIEGALLSGESGKAYLIGDENWTFQEFFQAMFDAVGNPQQVEVRNEEHPLLPDFAIIQGRGATIAYEPDQAAQGLGYTRNDVMRAIREAVAAFS